MCYTKGRTEEEKSGKVGSIYHELAKQAIKKISDEDTRIYMLIDY
jgi:hypothetical protein